MAGGLPLLPLLCWLPSFEVNIEPWRLVLLQDLEVKESAISTMGLLIAKLADKLKPEQLNACLPVMLDRLRNETTRIITLKALSTIAHSPLSVDLSSVCSDVVLECSTYLRKNDRALKQAALTSLNSIITRYASQIGGDLYEAVVKELAGLISDTELHLTHLALQLCETMVRCAPSTLPLMQAHILTRTTVLLQSSLLQGTALSSAKRLFSTLGRRPIPCIPRPSAHPHVMRHIPPLTQTRGHPSPGRPEAQHLNDSPGLPEAQHLNDARFVRMPRPDL